MIKICTDLEEVAEYKKLLSLIDENDEFPSLIIDFDVFKNARMIFKKNGPFISVLDKKGENLLFYLKDEKDITENYLGKYAIDINYEGGGLISEKYLDTTLVERADTYVFEEVEEYTFAITEFLRYTYPQKKIIYMDSRAHLFWPESSRMIYIESIWEMENKRVGNCMYIKSDWKCHNEDLPDIISNIFNSVNVLNSLCWARKVSRLGSLNEDKTILLIDCDFGGGNGLAYIVRTVCVFAEMAYERGWLPVANLRGSSMYTDHYGENIWEYYFKPISEISVEDAMKSKNVIMLSENHSGPLSIWYNPYFRSAWHQGAKYKVFIKDNLKMKFNIKMLKPLADEDVRVLGVLVRGTDNPRLKNPLNNIDIQAMISECREAYKGGGGYSSIFLATEDQQIYDEFFEAFGDQLISVNQKRVFLDKSNSGSLIGELLAVPQNKRREFGEAYLFVTYCLAKCNALLYNFKVGAYYLMDKWKGKTLTFEWERQIGRNKTQYEFSNLLKCIQYIKENSLTAIYGTGADAEKFFTYLKKMKNKIIFVDQKARYRKFLFHGCIVITPEDMEYYLCQKKIQGIILATTRYASEIKNELIEKGIATEQILQVGIEDLSVFGGAYL